MKDRWWLHKIANKIIDFGDWLDIHAHAPYDEEYEALSWSRYQTDWQATCCDGACDKKECGCDGCVC